MAKMPGPFFGPSPALTEGELAGLVRLSYPGSHDSAVNSATIIAHVIWAHIERVVFIKNVVKISATVKIKSNVIV